MEGSEPIAARLVQPPPLESRLVRKPRPRLGELIGGSMAAALRLKAPWALLACARLLRSAGWSAPLLVALGIFRSAWAQSEDPLSAFLGLVAAPEKLLPGFGLLAAALVNAGLLELLGLAFALPALAGREPAPPFARRFTSLVQTAALLLLIALILAALFVPTAALAASTWLDALGASGSGGLLASLSLALVLALAALAALLFRLGADAALAHAGTRGEGTLSAIYEGTALILREPGLCIAAFYLLGIAGLLAAAAFGFPAALAPPGGAAFGLDFLAGAATAAATSLLALTRLGVFARALR